MTRLTIICVLGLMSVLPFSPAYGSGFAEAIESDPGVLPPGIMPVIILQGSDHEMGIQYGQQAGKYLLARKESSWARALQTMSREKITHELKARQWHIKKNAPEAIAMMKGMAEGAKKAGFNIDFIDVLLMNTGVWIPGPTWTYPRGAENEEIRIACSAWAAWGKTTLNGRLVCGDSQDRPFFHSAAIVAFPEVGNSYVSPGIVGYLTHKPCLNNRGVCVGVTGGVGVREIDHDYGLPFHTALHHIMRFADSAEQAKNMLLSWNIAECTSWMISDVGGDAYVVECTSAVKSVRKPGDFGESDFIYCTNNYLHEEMKDAIGGLEFVDHAGWKGKTTGISSIPRNREMWTFFTRYHGQIDLDFAKMMWRFPGDPPPYPRGDEFFKAYRESNGKNWNPKICNLLNASVSIALPDKGDKGIMLICTGPAGKIAYPSVPRGGAQFQIAGTHSFYELTLAAGPAEVVQAALVSAYGCIFETNREFMHLKLDDSRYRTLNDLFSTAKTEYYQGLNWSNKARLTSGNQALFNLAQAATAFTRSQAHARQVYNELVPPPAKPDDLGLKPYKETSWGKEYPSETKNEKNSRQE